MTKIRATFYLVSGEKRSTFLEVENIKEAQLEIRNSFRRNVAFSDAEYPNNGNTFEIFENHVVCIDYEKAE
ncbi:hypothetical protein [Bacillus pseudomycoides]|uniref:hypothetical protein n=1 Tax=Bacillus pseudomycoides TaxID=64104 RepID=UPI000BF132F6|nr:hypothetical protein [Bacillus pseudomycoides]PEK34083.1 hypothetical protein CN691_12745 [Bacillus pseudomycoides]